MHTKVKVQILHPTVGCIIETYDLRNASDMACWAYNSRHFITSVKEKIYEEVENPLECMAQIEAASREKKLMLKQINKEAH